MQTTTDWSPFPNFTPNEFRCRHTGRVMMAVDFMHRLQKLRHAFAQPMPISSGYRDPTHPREAAKQKPGPHSTGCAADVIVYGPDAHRLLLLALVHGFTGIGVQQKGPARFIHLDTLPPGIAGPRPFVWSY